MTFLSNVAVEAEVFATADGGRDSVAEGGSESAVEGGKESEAEGGRESAAEGGRDSGAEAGTLGCEGSGRPRPALSRRGKDPDHIQ